MRLNSGRKCIYSKEVCAATAALFDSGDLVNDWPHTIPHDLAEALARLDEYRFGATDADRWGVIREWLTSHGVEAPERLPQAPEIRTNSAQ